VYGLVDVSAVVGYGGQLAVGLNAMDQLRASVLQGKSVSKILIHLLKNSEKQKKQKKVTAVSF
jgi:hypothetical protein